MEEALCYWWIDSLANKLDDERFLLLFSPRKPKSGRSRLNKQRIARLGRSGRMTPIGKAGMDAEEKPRFHREAACVNNGAQQSPVPSEF